MVPFFRAFQNGRRNYVEIRHSESKSGSVRNPRILLTDLTDYLPKTQMIQAGNFSRLRYSCQKHIWPEYCLICVAIKSRPMKGHEAGNQLV